MKNSSILKAACIFLAAGLNGCATTQQKAEGPPLQQALAREAQLTKEYAVSADDGFFSASLAASGKPRVVSQESVHQVTVPIGTKVAAECFVYHDAMDAAATLGLLIDELVSDMPQTQVLKIDAGTFGQHPYLYQERLYLTGDDAAGVLKGIVVPFDSTLLACIHDTPGYSETFLRMAASFAKTMVVGNDTGENLVHEEVLVWRLGDMDIGFTINQASVDQEGDIKSTVETAFLLPRSASQIMAHDEFNIVYEEPNGDIINGHYAEAENGEVKLSLRLDRAETAGYRVTGTYQGKAVDAPLQAAANLVGPYYQHREMLRSANPASGQPTALTLDAYLPSANPVKTVRFGLSPTGAVVDGLPEYELAFAGLRGTGLIDNKGQKSMMLKLGGMEIELSRAYVNTRP